MFRLTNTSSVQTIVIHDRHGRRQRFKPGETRLIDLDQIDGNRRAGLKRTVLRCETANRPSNPADREASRRQAETTLAKPVAIDVLVSQAEAGEIGYNDLRKAGATFLEGPTPQGKDKIIEALRARAAAIRATG